MLGRFQARADRRLDLCLEHRCNRAFTRKRSPQGDAFFVAFERATDAVAAAETQQRHSPRPAPVRIVKQKLGHRSDVCHARSCRRPNTQRGGATAVAR
jgi:hypothetical protein